MVEDAVRIIRGRWTGAGLGFQRPDPRPPIIIGAFGPKMAEFSGRVGDGINTQAFNPHLGDLLKEARTAAGERPFLATSSACSTTSGSTPGRRAPQTR